MSFALTGTRANSAPSRELRLVEVDGDAEKAKVRKPSNPKRKAEKSGIILAGS
ncbi:MAG: hypothetical protein LBR22_02680 [Desulfovibrio sp.]|jgi:hypothetical protein|nr:hypothetical protein [Desulfovibrio sp.]